MPHRSRIPNGLWGVQLLPLWVSSCYLFSSGLEPSSGPSPSVREFHPLGPAGPPAKVRRLSLPVWILTIPKDMKDLGTLSQTLPRPFLKEGSGNPKNLP